MKKIEMKNKEDLELLSRVLDVPIKSCVIFENIVFTLTEEAELDKQISEEDLDDLVDRHSKMLDEFEEEEDSQKEIKTLSI